MDAVKFIHTSIIYDWFHTSGTQTPKSPEALMQGGLHVWRTAGPHSHQIHVLCSDGSTILAASQNI